MKLNYKLHRQFFDSMNTDGIISRIEEIDIEKKTRIEENDYIDLIPCKEGVLNSFVNKSIEKIDTYEGQAFNVQYIILRKKSKSISHHPLLIRESFNPKNECKNNFMV